jgi:vacuolar-type H+-ATPase subunit E/Vma4
MTRTRDLARTLMPPDAPREGSPVKRKELQIRMTVPPRNVVRVSQDDPLPPIGQSRSAERSRPVNRPSTLGNGSGEAPRPNPADVALEVTRRQLAADRQFLESALETMAEELRQNHEDHRASLGMIQQQAIQLAMSIAEGLLYRELKNEKFEIAGMVRDVVKQMDGDEAVTVKLHPRDLELMQERLAGLPLLPDAEWTPRLEASPEVPRGGCVVEGNPNSLATDPASRIVDMRGHILERIANARA